MLDKLMLEFVSFLLGLLDSCFLLLRILGNARPKFFSGGYGDLTLYHKRLSSTLRDLKAGSYEFRLQEKDIEWMQEKVVCGGRINVREGNFRSPVAHLLPHESANCNFRLVGPKKNKDDATVYIIMLPATGEMGSSTRMAMAKDLALRHGWSSIIVTAPFYGVRKPKLQTLFFLNTVTDILLQSQAVIEESAALAMYCLCKSEETKVCFTGFSYGAAMSGCSAAFLQQQLVSEKKEYESPRVACAAYVGSASPNVLADGVLKSSVDWCALMADSTATNKSLDMSTAQTELYEEFNKTQLSMLLVNNDEKQTGPTVHVRAYSMNHDAFIQKRYAQDFASQLKAMAGDNVDGFSTYWIPGGHVTGAIARSFLHKRLVEETMKSIRRD